MTPFPLLDPQLYHAHHTLRADDLPFWQTLAQKYGDPILELGCGTGRVLLTLAQNGFSVTGLDADTHMLACLRASLPSEMSHLSLYQMDMRDFHLPQSFRLILLPCNTYSTFPSEERVRIAQTVHRHLSSRGIFAFSVPNPALLASLEPFSDFELEETFPHPQTNDLVAVFSQWKKTPETLTFTWRYDQQKPNGETISQFATTCHQLDTPEMYLDELRYAGLSPVALYGNYARAPFKPEVSIYLIILAQRESV